VSYAGTFGVRKPGIRRKRSMQKKARHKGFLSFWQGSISTT